MNNNKMSCQFCGFTPPQHEQPRSGTWFCPKCGKRVSISRPVSLPRRHPFKKPPRTQKSRDQISNQIYSKITKISTPDLGLKERYLKPVYEPIIPKKRKKIRIFSKSKED